MLVVLGAAVWPGGVPSPTLRRRAEWAARLFLAGGFDRMVLSGGVGVHPPAEADVMARIAAEAGVADTSLVLDRDAATTIDTAAFAARLPGAETIAFTAVTDRYHAWRTRLAFRAYGLTIRLSCPPRGTGTASASLIYAYLREAPAMILYAGYYLRRRLSARR